jgi:ubiquinone/menaquinone biosynthesis C-methylase UbiE
MTTESALPVVERLRRLFQHLGIERAHIAGRSPSDWRGLASDFPEMVASLTLLGPTTVDPQTVAHLASRLLVITGDRGPTAENARVAMAHLPEASVVFLPNYSLLSWSDVVADRPDEVGSALLHFLSQAKTPPDRDLAPAAEKEGEIAGISYRIEGLGPPLVLLPLFLAPSQWGPLVSRLSERHRTITLGGAELGAAAALESRGRAPGYLQMVRTIIEETDLLPGQTVLDVGCGTGVLDRWLARRTGGQNPIVGVDINRYLMREAAALTRKDGLERTITFRQGNAETLPFPDSSFDVTMAVTVIEELDADRMLGEMVRVSKPGGRVAVIARAIDVPFLTNLSLGASLQSKVEVPGLVGQVTPQGCADRSLYRRAHDAGLTRMKMFTQLVSFDSADTTLVQYMEAAFVPKLSQDEAHEWRAARADAEARGTFFMAWPHHCTVGTKP